MREGVAADFSGFGAVIYRGELFDLPISPLVLDSTIQPPVDKDETIAATLISLSRYSDTRHDGFHFIHHRRGLTNLSVFISPPIPVNYDPKQYDVGARHRAAELTSLMSEVDSVIVVDKKGGIYIFLDGQASLFKYEK